MKVGIVGSREWENWANFYFIIEEINKQLNITEVHSGGAKGTDGMAKRWAIQKGIKYVEWPADWKRWGKAAGPKRNEQIVDAVEYLIAFPKLEVDGTYSKGTASSIKNAEMKGKPITIIPLR